MLNLTEREYDFYTWNGVRIELNLAFDNVLLLFELFSDKELEIAMKLDIALQMLVVDKVLLHQLHGEQPIQLALDILKDKLGIELLSNKVEERQQVIPIYDFVEDAERIYSSFLFDYNLDLIEQQGKLQWDKFIALFKNLSNESPMGQALYYRTCEIPPKDKHNAEERKRIKKMKEKYELPKAKEIREQREFEAFQKKMEAQKAQMEGR